MKIIITENEVKEILIKYVKTTFFITDRYAIGIYNNERDFTIIFEIPKLIKGIDNDSVIGRSDSLGKLTTKNN